MNRNLNRPSECRSRNFVGVEKQDPFVFWLAIFERPVSLRPEACKRMLVNPRPRILRDLLGVIVTPRINDHDFAKTRDRSQTTRQIVRFVMGQNDDSERLRRSDGRLRLRFKMPPI